MTASNSTANAGKSPAPIKPLADYLGGERINTHDQTLGDLCTAIEHQSNQAVPEIRIHQLDGMIELAGQMSDAKLTFPAILFGFLHFERDRLEKGRAPK